MRNSSLPQVDCDGERANGDRNSPQAEKKGDQEIQLKGGTSTIQQVKLAGASCDRALVGHLLQPQGASRSQVLFLSSDEPDFPELQLL
ncbi:hypothetical protein CB1_000968012 [Camelus ferus]|nr:hypothetical protein CB1_000968012 [Camelus ferus]